ncbi:sprT domain-containing protein [Halobacteriales archaeon QS_1_68_17]|nr:MAG: sprT domain-containing protein [Halobacteriales archaeon QS_1_68_17]
MSADEPETRAELLDRAAAYAETVDLDLDLGAVDWTISERAKRRAGCCRYDADAGRITIALTWAAYREFGWPAFAGTVRHELVHAWEFAAFGESGHGPRFREKAAEIDAPRHCRPFADARLVLVCADDDCEWHAERHRASKTVRTPGAYRCGDCGDPYRVRHVASGRIWETRAGYRRARDGIDDW